MCLISEKSYSSKPTAEQYAHMRFVPFDGDSLSLYEKVTEGHTICNAHTAEEACSIGASVIVIDIDYSETPLSDFIKYLYKKPTFAHESYTSRCSSDVYKFHLVYMLSDTIHSEESFRQNVQLIVDTLPSNTDFKYRVDDCSFRVSQRYNGVKKRDTRECLYFGNIIVHLDTYTEHAAKVSQNGWKVPNSGCLDFGSIWNSTDKLVEFKKRYIEANGMPNILYSSNDFEVVPHEAYHIEVCNDYVECPRKNKYDNNGFSHVEKWHDKENRHTKLFVAACVIIKLNKDVSHETLMYALIDEYLTYYEYDSKFDKRWFEQCLNDAIKGDEIKGRFKRKCHMWNEYQHYEAFKRFNRWSIIYNPTKRDRDGNRVTNKQQIEYMKNNGIDVSSKTFEKYVTKYNDMINNGWKITSEGWIHYELDDSLWLETSVSPSKGAASALP